MIQTLSRKVVDLMILISIIYEVSDSFMILEVLQIDLGLLKIDLENQEGGVKNFRNIVITNLACLEPLGLSAKCMKLLL